MIDPVLPPHELPAESQGVTSQTPRKIKQRQQMMMFGAGALLLVVIVAGMFMTQPPSKGQAQTAESGSQEEAAFKRLASPTQGLNEREVWIARSEARLKEQQDQIEELLRWKEAREEEERRLLEAQAKTPGRAVASSGTASATLMPPPLPLSGVTPPPLPPIPQATAANGAISPIPPGNIVRGTPSGRAALAPGASAVAAGSAIQRVTFGTKAQPPSSGDKGTVKSEQRHVGRWIPAGTFTRGVLLGGLDAPAGGQAQSNPHPVLVKLQDNSILPNRFRTRTRECHIVGAGYGDISAERAYIRLETLSCVLKDGKIIEVGIQGYLAGEDGKTGMRGKLVTKEGQLLSRAFLAGLGSGFGDALSKSVTTLSTGPLGTTQSIDPGNVLKHGAYSGVGKAMDRLAQYYITLAEKTFPVIEVAAGRSVDVVLTKGVALEEDINLAWDDMAVHEEELEP